MFFKILTSNWSKNGCNNCSMFPLIFISFHCFKGHVSRLYLLIALSLLFSSIIRHPTFLLKRFFHNWNYYIYFKLNSLKLYNWSRLKRLSNLKTFFGPFFSLFKSLVKRISNFLCFN